MVVKLRFYKHNIPVNYKTGSKHKLKIDRVVELRRQGLTVQQIADKYDISRQAVNQFLIRNNIK